VARWFNRRSAGAGRCLWSAVEWLGGPGRPRIGRLGYVVLEGESRIRLLSTYERPSGQPCKLAGGALRHYDMLFILGVVFFVGAVGAIDARLPWPRPRSSGRDR
jgi:hypothetical protein